MKLVVLSYSGETSKNRWIGRNDRKKRRNREEIAVIEVRNFLDCFVP